MKKAITLCDQCQADIPDGRGINIQAREPRPTPRHPQQNALGGEWTPARADLVLTNRSGVAVLNRDVDFCSPSCAGEWAAGIQHVEGKQ